MFAWLRILLVFVLLGLGACGDGCRRDAREDARGPQALALVPHDTRTVLGLDFERFRAAPAWQRLSALAVADARDRRLIDEMKERTGVDPLRDVSFLLAAFPEDARVQGQFGLVVKGRGFDERRLVTFARDRSSLAGRDWGQKNHAGRRLWYARGADDLAGFFVDGATFVLARGGWAERMAALAAPAAERGAARSAAQNPELANLVSRVAGGHTPALWAAAIVPLSVRDSLASDPRFDAARHINRLAAALELSPDGAVALRVRAELSTGRDAERLVARVRDSVAAARSNPRLLLLGLAPHLESIDSRAQGPNALLSVTLAPAQVDDLLDRLQTLSAFARQVQAGPGRGGDAGP